MIGSLKILRFSIMGYNSYTKVILPKSIYQKNFLSGQGQFGTNLIQNHATLFHDSLYEDVFKDFWHDEALDKSSISHFSKKISFSENIGPFGSNYTTNRSREF